jgi:hypothetical protein
MFNVQYYEYIGTHLNQYYLYSGISPFIWHSLGDQVYKIEMAMSCNKNEVLSKF